MDAFLNSFVCARITSKSKQKPELNKNKRKIETNSIEKEMNKSSSNNLFTVDSMIKREQICLIQK